MKKYLLTLFFKALGMIVEDDEADNKAIEANIDAQLEQHQQQQQPNDDEHAAEVIDGLEEEALGKISFYLMPNYSVNIHCDWKQRDIDNTAVMYGKMLHMITSGLFSEEIVNILTKYKNSVPVEEEFILAVCKEWNSNHASRDDGPIVSPAEVFRG